MPRSSQDLDLVIDPDAASLRRFLASLPAAEYYADADAALDALRGRGQFNVIDTATAWKAALIVRKARPFSIEEMRRPIEGNLLGARILVASAEDTVIAKLEWSKLGGGSELQLRDAAGIVALLGASKLDLAYIERWVRELGLEDLWRRLLATGAEEERLDGLTPSIAPKDGSDDRRVGGTAHVV